MRCPSQSVGTVYGKMHSELNHFIAMSMIDHSKERTEPRYGEVPKHASIACRQHADFVGKEVGKKKDFEKKTSKLFMSTKICI